MNNALSEIFAILRDSIGTPIGTFLSSRSQINAFIVRLVNDILNFFRATPDDTFFAYWNNANRLASLYSNVIVLLLLFGCLVGSWLIFYKLVKRLLRKVGLL